MRQLNTCKAIACSGLLLAASQAAMAASESFNVKFTTMQDVVLSQVQALNYGPNVFVASGGTCSLNALEPSDVTAQTDGGLSANNWGDLTGSGCINVVGGGTPGVYRVEGLAGRAVTITVGSVAGSEFSFTPNMGCIAQHDNAAAGDSCDADLADTATPASIAGAGDTGNAVAGELIFTVGGTILKNAVSVVY